MSELPARPVAGTCDTPFESGGQLCRVCRKQPEGETGRRCSRMVAQSAAMQAVLEKAATIAHTDASVVIRGESGSGKEVLARALHANSERRAKPFVAINCAALPAELLESELFGHVRGAFTGAHATRRGLFEAADGGTLFLDEIAEMPAPLQAKLLRALQDGEIRRVGDSQPIHVDVRVLCATHQDLQLAIREKRFREDLFYRLKVFTLTVPPLRERKDDIPVLASLFLHQEKHATGRFTTRAMTVLTKYPWPGNVRELANAVKHGAVLSMSGDVDAPHLPEELGEPALAMLSSGDEPLTTLAEAEKRHVLKVLKACGGQQVEAARVLGIGRTTLWRKLKEWGLDA
jgi:two-component system response regulator HydG